MNHQSHIPTLVLMMTFVTFAGVALAGTEPDDRWTGGGKPCWGGDRNWSTDANWESGVAPSSGDLWINAGDVCDPCDYGFCVFPCQPPEQCSGECNGGPNHGEECESSADCAPCDAGSFIVLYDLSGSEETYGQVEVFADSAHNMTLRKLGDRDFNATAGLFLTGSSSKKAVLDVDAGDMQPSVLGACSTVEIDVATYKTLVAKNEFRVGCSGTDTTATLKGGGFLDVSTTGGATKVQYSAILELEGSVTLKPRDLYVFGGSGSSYEAEFLHTNSSASIAAGTLTGVKMRGYSRITVDKAVDYTVVNNIEVDTDGGTTDAAIDLASDSQKITAANLTITAGANPATLTMKTGILDIDGDVKIGAEGATATAKLTFESALPTLKDVILNARGVLEIPATLTLTEGDFIIGKNANNADVVTAPGEDLAANVIVFREGATFTPNLATGSDLRTN